MKALFALLIACLPLAGAAQQVAITIDDLPALLPRNPAKGWSFVTPPEALNDPLYSAKDSYTGPRGVTQV